MNIKVDSWRSVKDFINNKEYFLTDDFAIISVINEDNLEFVAPIGVPHLHLEVYDIDDEFKKYPNFFDEYPNYKFFDQSDAQKIKDFVELHKDNVDYFLIHCHAGVSRSRAVGAALDLVYNGDDKEHFKGGVPNMTVYKEMLKVYGLTNEYPEEEKDYTEIKELTNLSNLANTDD